MNLGKTKVVVSGAESEVSVSKVDPCGIHLWEASNGNFSVVCEMQKIGRCTKVKRVTLRLGRDFVCGRCMKQVDGLVELVEELWEEVEKVQSYFVHILFTR